MAQSRFRLKGGVNSSRQKSSASLGISYSRKTTFHWVIPPNMIVDSIEIQAFAVSRLPLRLATSRQLFERDPHIGVANHG
jgi:hypothetical protein